MPFKYISTRYDIANMQELVKRMLENVRTLGIFLLMKREISFSYREKNSITDLVGLKVDEHMDGKKSL